MTQNILPARDLRVWEPIHGASIDPLPDHSVTFIDGRSLDYHLLRATDERFRGATLSLRLSATPAPTCSSELYVNHWGAIDVIRIDPSGAVLSDGLTSKSRVVRDPLTGRLDVRCVFFNTHPTLSIGTTVGPHGRYAGSGMPQYIFHEISVDRFPDIPMENRIRLVDVGALGGLPLEWRKLGGSIVPVCFEPNPAAAEALRPDISGFDGGMVHGVGLFDTDGPQMLNMARHVECSSLLEPNKSVLKRYAVGPLFEVLRQTEVHCRRYDSLFAEGVVPEPDLLKIDVQGAEYQVLSGFGALLENVLAIELESHVYPIYHGQRLLGELVELLDSYGLGLRRMDPQPNFDGELVEFNLFFTRRHSTIRGNRDLALDKLAIIERVWGLQVYPGGKVIAQSFENT
jgi:FkbM family methyltransferase